MPRHFGIKLRRLCLQRFDNPTDDRDMRRTCLLAFVTGHAIEYPGQLNRSPDLLRITAWIKRGLAQLNQRRGTGEIGQVSEADDRTGRVAAHATDAIERLGSVLHLLVGERLGEPCVRLMALDPRLKTCDLFFVAGSIDDEIANDGQVAQRLDDHVRLDRLPAGKNLAAVHSDRAGSAHLRSAEPSKRQIRGRILRNPVQGVQHPHPFLVRHPKLLVDVAACGDLGPAHPERQEIARRQPGIARGQRVVLFDLPQPAAVNGQKNGHRNVAGRNHCHQETSRLSFLEKPGANSGRS